MFAEKLDRATEITPGSRPFPNLRARETVKSVVTNIVETINHCPSMSEQSKVSFMVGYVRGAIDVLRVDCEDQDVQFSALPHLLDMLDTLNQGGLKALRALAENVTGQELREAEEKQRLSDLLPPLASLGPEWQKGLSTGLPARGLGSDECTCPACKQDRALLQEGQNV